MIEDLSNYAWFKERLTKEELEALSLIFEDREWSLGKTRTILYPYEIEDLATVPTTVPEAETILQRNAQLLTTEELELVEIGCPHCKVYNARYDCAGCAWSVLQWRSRCTFDSCPCTQQGFGGYTLGESGVEYASGYAQVRMLRTTDDIPVPRSTVSVFLGAHIEWALMLLHGEIKPCETRFRYWSVNRQKSLKRKVRGALREQYEHEFMPLAGEGEK